MRVTRQHEANWFNFLIFFCKAARTTPIAANNANNSDANGAADADGAQCSDGGCLASGHCAAGLLFGADPEAKFADDSAAIDVARNFFCSDRRAQATSLPAMTALDAPQATSPCDRDDADHVHDASTTTTNQVSARESAGVVVASSTTTVAGATQAHVIDLTGPLEFLDLTLSPLPVAQRIPDKRLKPPREHLRKGSL